MTPTIEQLRAKCARQRRELQRLNRMIHSLRGAAAWWWSTRQQGGEAVIPIERITNAHHRNNTLARHMRSIGDQLGIAPGFETIESIRAEIWALQGRARKAEPYEKVEPIALAEREAAT